MRKDQGFTLVEVLVSVVILAILGVVFFEFFALSQKAAIGNKGKMEAVTLAHAILQDVKNGEYPEITNSSNSDFPKTFQNHRESGNHACDMGIVDDKAMCNARYEKTVNKQTLFIEIDVGTELEEGLKLHSVEVKIFDKGGKMQTSVRGVVEIWADGS